LRWGTFQSRHNEEIGSPHELILLALNRTLKVSQGNYRIQVKLLANLLRENLGEKPVKLKIPEVTDPSIGILISLVGRHPISLRQSLDKYRKNLSQLTEEFEKEQTHPSYSALKDFVQDGAFLHVLCRETRKTALLNKEELGKLLEIFGQEETLKGILQALEDWENSSFDSVPSELIRELTSAKEEPMVETAVFLTCILAMRSKSNKRELLLAHYMLLKKSVDQFKDIMGEENLTDELFEKIFRMAIVLSFCGYLKSIRLPHEEKLYYVEKIIGNRSLERTFEETFDRTANIRLISREVKLPLWTISLILVALLISHAFFEFYLPFEFSVLGVKFPYPRVPAFLTLAFFVSILMLWRIFSLKKRIKVNLRRSWLGE
jgi:hypothetical protein